MSNNARNREKCISLIEKLTDLAINCPDADRREDARQTINMMVLLKADPNGPEYPYPIVPHLEGALQKVLLSGLSPTLQAH